MRSGPIRFMGMASGMDTDSIVKDMLRPQQYKIDNQKKQQALLKLKQDAWKDMNKKLFDFHTKYTEKMARSGTYTKGVVSSSNENIIAINKDANVPHGSHTFSNIKLAESASAVGLAKGKDGKPLAGDTKLGDYAGEEITIKLDGSEEPIKITIGAGDTLASLATKMNEKLDGKGYTARYDEKSGGFFISSKATGSSQSIELSSNKESEASNFLKDLGFEYTAGKDAEYTYNGKKFTSSTNIIEINGIKATLKSASVDPVTITSQQDPDAVYDLIKEFVTEYNKLIDEINLKTSIKPKKDILPLTAEERKDMSESEIELWEESLNSSLFYRDPQLTDFADSARRILGQVVDGKSLASFGIVTGSWEERGKLHIVGDEDFPLHSDKPNKLKEALNKDQESLEDTIAFFQKLGKDLYKDHNDKFRASNELTSAMNFYNDKVMRDDMQRFDKEINRMEERLFRLEEMHYAKFAAMEKMLNALNNQSAWLSQQFGGN